MSSSEEIVALEEARINETRINEKIIQDNHEDFDSEVNYFDILQQDAMNWSILD